MCPDEPASLQALIYARLQAALHPDYLEVLDESAAHQGHGGYRAEGSHFAVIIQATSLLGLDRVTVHRKVYAALGDLLPDRIHALRIVHRDVLND